MPVEVRHEGGLGGLAALALLAGAAQARAPQAPMVSGGGGGGGWVRSEPGESPRYFEQQLERLGIGPEALRSQRRMEEDRNRAVLQGQLQSQGIMQRKEAELDMMQERAKSEAWVYEFTPFQRQEIAKLTNDYQRAMEDPTNGPAEREIIGRRYQERLNAIQPGPRPKTSQEQMIEGLNAQGRGPGATWQGQDGGWYTTTFDDNGQPVPKLLVRPDQTMEAIQAKLQADQEKELAETRLKLLSEEMVERGEEGTPTGAMRTRSLAEVEAILEKAFPQYKQRRIREDIEATAQQEAESQRQAAIPWWQRAREQGADVQPQDISLPSRAGQAQVLLRTMQRDFGGTPPESDPEARFKWNHAIQVLESYRAHLKSRQQ